ncbi:hypothetical protein [Streptomyces specialis]|uniref:hypothetical protein n=1 Tax=Streptomyces specialis TaxID=498367 RepID=UPI00073E4124|nr:hypothetical protein [Streptomyces specialis]
MAIFFMSKLTGLESVRLCVPGGAPLSGTGVSGAAAVRPVALASREAAAGERPAQASAAAVVAAAAARSRAYVSIAHVAGAGNQIFGQQKTQHHSMWALRGLDPWSDPA